MTLFAALAAPIALLWPFWGQAALLAPVPKGDVATSASAPDRDVQHERPYSAAFPIADQVKNPLDAFYGGQVVRQVRIERRVTVRISPRPSPNPNSLLARLPARGRATTFEERAMDRCVPVAGISGVQTGKGNRLILFLRDQRIVSLNLERACRARDFYSGFYVERNEDGQLCVDRDKLQSRSGAKCEVERMRQLVAVDD
jgi:hypothetical protein